MKRTLVLNDDALVEVIREELLSHIKVDEYPAEPETLLALIRVYNFYSTPDEQLEVFAGVAI